MKEGLVRKNAAAPDMEQIGRYTRRAYSPEEVYTFSLVLCDNEVDRDFERFSREALEGSWERQFCWITRGAPPARQPVSMTRAWKNCQTRQPRRESLMCA